MTDSDAGGPQPTPPSDGGWYPDPLGRYDSRYHNGSSWTADVAVRGARYVDPLGAAWTPTRNGLATAAAMLGVIGVATAWLPFLFVLGAAASAVAIGLGLAGLSRARKSQVGHSRAVVGITTGACGLLAAAGGAALTVVVLDTIDRFEHPNPHTVTIEDCIVVGRRATADGALTNEGESDADFVVRVEFLRPGTDNAASTASVDLRDVAAGDTVTFTTARSVELDDVECAVSEVTGPLPFGLDIG